MHGMPHGWAAVLHTDLPTYIIHMLSDLQSISALVYCSGGGQWPFLDKPWKGHAGDYCT